MVCGLRFCLPQFILSSHSTTIVTEKGENDYVECNLFIRMRMGIEARSVRYI